MQSSNPEQSFAQVQLEPIVPRLPQLPSQRQVPPFGLPSQSESVVQVLTQVPLEQMLPFGLASQSELTAHLQAPPLALSNT